MGVIYWNHSIFLLSLFSPICFVHVECIESIWPEGGVCQGLVKNEEHLVVAELGLATSGLVDKR
jgi:hypothetical protein